MIRTMVAKNFKSLRDVRVDLERFTVIVGPNASGKSSVLKALELVCQSADRGALEDGSVLKDSSSFGSDGDVELAARADGPAFRFFNPPRRSSANHPGGHPGTGVITKEVASAPDFNVWTAWQPKQSSDRPLPKTELLQLESSRLMHPHVNSRDHSRMSPDGVGLHYALANMTLNDPDSWQSLQSHLRGIIPTIRRLRHAKRGPQEPPSLLFDTVGADSLTASQVSEGTLLVLGLLTALYASERPSVILLDDLDRGLHPKAQRDLVKLLRGLLDANQDWQIVATTHSPYLLNCMEPSEVRMTCLRDDGSTACGPLENHPQFKKWKDEMAPGEMWSLFGEKWLVEPSRAAA